MHRFYGSLRRIRNFPTGRCRHRPLHSSRRLHLLFTIFRAEQARQGEAYHHAAHKNSVSAKAVTEVTLMANDETFRYDPTPMNHAFPGQPDDCFDSKNRRSASRSADFVFIPTFATPPGSIRRWPVCRCGRWAFSSAPGGQRAYLLLRACHPYSASGRSPGF